MIVLPACEIMDHMYDKILPLHHSSGGKAARYQSISEVWYKASSGLVSSETRSHACAELMQCNAW